MSRAARFVPAGRLLAGLLVLGTGSASPATSQTAPDASDDCTCASLLDALVERVETNHPGYILEVRGTALEGEYRSRVTAARARARTAAAGIPCLRVLQEYVALLEDGHLFVGGGPAPRDSTPGPGRRIDWTEDRVRRHLEERGRALDPVDGIWFDPAGLRLAVVERPVEMPPGPEAEGFTRVAFVLESSVDAWKHGDVKAELAPLPDGSYDVILYDDDRTPTRPHVYKRGMAGGGRLQRGSLLFHAPPTTWGKLHPVRPGEEGGIDPVDPRAPTARIDERGAVVFHVPSNVPAHAPRLRALVEQYRAALERSETLVIDLRGNEGGSAFVTNVLVPFLATPEKRPPRYLAEGESAVLSTPDNIAYFERQSWSPARLVERLRAAPGSLVPFQDPDPAAPAESVEPPDRATPRPSRVALLIDGMTVSAAEAFVLRAMRNGKVTLFGEPTGASIDYQTVGIVRFGCPDAGLYLGYPTIVGSDRLPEGGVRPTGIVPDVPLDPDEADPVGRILEYYRSRG
ncbi:MAG TPA: S41 family peptidase [Gemmatimonadota bacterium]|nr:S41 family peptidase [Gemmatimonadota bacterium]